MSGVCLHLEVELNLNLLLETQAERKTIILSQNVKVNVPNSGVGGLTPEPEGVRVASQDPAPWKSPGLRWPSLPLPSSAAASSPVRPSCVQPPPSSASLERGAASPSRGNERPLVTGPMTCCATDLRTASAQGLPSGDPFLPWTLGTSVVLLAHHPPSF